MSALNIGNTPLIQLNIAAPARLFAKGEGGNPGGSIKDRVALAIIEDAEEKGVLKAGGLVVEATSGNTGIGLSLVCKAKGYRAVIVMPDSMSKERRELIKSYGGEVVLTDGAKGMQGAVERRRKSSKTAITLYLPTSLITPYAPRCIMKAPQGRFTRKQTEGRISSSLAWARAVRLRVWVDF